VLPGLDAALKIWQKLGPMYPCTLLPSSPLIARRLNVFLPKDFTHVFAGPYLKTLQHHLLY